MMCEEKVNELILCKDEFGDKLFETLGKTLELLLTAGYEAEVYYDESEMGIIVIKYDYHEDEFGGPRARWLSAEDWGDFCFWKEEIKNDSGEKNANDDEE